MTLRMLHTYSEDWLVQRCKERDRKAQRMLYERYAPQMMALCKRYVKHQEDAEEVLSNTMVKVFRGIGEVQQKGSLEAWVKRIAINESLNHLRSNRTVFDLEIEEERAAVQESDPHALEDLQQLVEHLPNGYRTVFNLYAIEGFSHREIAEELGITENASRSQLTKARQQLRQWIDQRDKRRNHGR